MLLASLPLKDSAPPGTTEPPQEAASLPSSQNNHYLTVNGHYCFVFFSKFLFMSFKPLLFHTFPVQPFFLLQFYLLKNPEHLTCRILQRNILYKLEAGPTGLIPFAKLLCSFIRGSVISGCPSLFLAAVAMQCLDPSFHLRLQSGEILTLSHVLANVKRKF